MENIEYINKYIEESISVKLALASDEILIQCISDVAEICINCYQNGNKILLAGNGGSAADSQHIAAELVSRFLFDRPGLPAIALTTDSSMLTAIGNDYGFNNLFARQIIAQGVKGDVFIGISTSGSSQNIIEAVNAAKSKQITTICLSGSEGKLKNICDYSILVPSNCTPHIQESHILIGHLICAIIEERLFNPNN